MKQILTFSESTLIFNLEKTKHTTMNVGQLRKHLEQYADDTNIYFDIDCGYALSPFEEKYIKLVTIE